MNSSASSISLTTNLTKKITQLVSKSSFEEALHVYKHLHSSGIHGDPSYLPSVLRSCSPPRPLAFALQLHCTIIKTANAINTITMNSLLSAYSKHCQVGSARLLFDTMLLRDLVTWNSMLSCYISNGYLLESMETFMEMQYCGLKVKPELVASVLSVCGRTGDLRRGKEIHAYAMRNGDIDRCILLATSLVDVYSRCHDLDAAMKLFGLMPVRNLVSWTAMITGCLTNRDFSMAVEVFRKMINFDGIQPERATLVAVLPACAALGALKHGKEIHGYVVKHGFEAETKVVGALVDMYCKFKEAFRLGSIVFESSNQKDIIMWSSMMVNSYRHGDSIGTMKLFSWMLQCGLRPNSVTMLALVAACIGLSSMDHGRRVHGYILKSCHLSDVFVSNSLIDMYAKCGCLNSSGQVFKEMPVKDSVSYSSMISSYGLHGHGHEALRLFHEMQEMKVKPDSVTLLAVLMACNHSGLVNEGKEFFNLLTRHCSLVPALEHYACYVDLLGRSGRLEDACEVIQSMPMRPSPRILSSLVAACRIHGRFEAAQRVALWLINREPENAANYTLLSTIYAEDGNWRGKEEVKRVMVERGMKKSCGYSQIEERHSDCFPSVM